LSHFFSYEIVCASGAPCTGGCASIALDEKWTRDPFDRLIVANAKGFAWLISADEAIRKHYPRAVW
jgi:PIN domain nuclease of toxin-antitoxin system